MLLSVNARRAFDLVIRLLKITLITTGGTIDGADADRGSSRDSSSAEEWLRSRNDLELNVCRVVNKDSRQITAEDRQLIIDAVSASSDEKIIVSHGTFTIAETGRALKSAQLDARATILLVGAWIPFGEPNSDAPAQMEFALKTLRRGVPVSISPWMGGCGILTARQKRNCGPEYLHFAKRDASQKN